MRYIGGKNRIARDIAPVILQSKPKVVVEPFCGALSVTVALVACDPEVKVICSDIHTDLVDMWIAIQNGWVPPKHVSRAEYNELRNAQSSPLRTFVGYGCSFSGKWFGGYAEDKSARDYALNAHNSVMKRAPVLSHVEFRHGTYLAQRVMPEEVVYCDPPYASTTRPGARQAFDHDAFWRWVQALPARCYVSEYKAPRFAREVWKKEVKTDMHTQEGQVARIERLFCNR